MIETEIILCGIVFVGVFVLWQWSGIETKRTKFQNAMIGVLVAAFFALIAFAMFVVGRCYLIP